MTEAEFQIALYAWLGYYRSNLSDITVREIQDRLRPLNILYKELPEPTATVHDYIRLRY